MGKAIDGCKAVLTVFVLAVSLSWGSDSQYKGENFDDFLLEFIGNSEFQKERIQFPLPSITMDMETEKFDTVRVEKQAWRFNEFRVLKTGIQVRQYDNFQRKLRDSGERVISLVGNDNGLYYSYFFKRYEGRWYLIRILDESS